MPINDRYTEDFNSFEAEILKNLDGQLDPEWTTGGDKFSKLSYRIELFYRSYPRTHLSQELAKHDLKSLFTTEVFNKIFKGFTGEKNSTCRGRVVDMRFGLNITK